jgi:hypothetical protein
VVLLKGTAVYQNVPVLSGKCNKCQAIYYADHESGFPDNNASISRQRLYLNQAQYLKVGQELWADRSFTNAVVNAMYNFHASTSAIAAFWNESFFNHSGVQVTRLQIWRTFVQETIRQISASSHLQFETPDGLALDEVTKLAFQTLGEKGVIRSAQNHFCKDCTHKYKSRPDRLTGDDPAATVGIDEHQSVPPLTGPEADLAIRDAALARYNAEHAMAVDEDDSNESDESDDESKAPVNMIVMDGIVMGPNYCAFENCTKDLANYKNGIFCVEHEYQRQGLCHIKGCNSPKVEQTKACVAHQSNWRSYITRFGHQSVLGIHRLIRRTEEESQPWLPAISREVQRHDDPENENTGRNHYFSPSRYYCVETMCLPCGVVTAWTKFATAESPTNILNWLESVYPTPDS